MYAVRRLAQEPNEARPGPRLRQWLARDFEGDVYEILRALPFHDDEHQHARALTVTQKAELATVVARAGGAGRAPAPPPEEAVVVRSPAQQGPRPHRR